MVLKLPIRGPSIDSLHKKLGITKSAATAIKRAMDEGKPKTALNLAEKAMCGFGVENLYPDYPDFHYVNMGETYSTTLCYSGKAFHIGSWGDYVDTHYT